MVILMLSLSGVLLISETLGLAISGSGDTAKTADENVETACKAIKTTPLYGGVSDEGAIAVSATAPEYGPVLKVVEATTMPDGTFGLKFQVVTA